MRFCLLLNSVSLCSIALAKGEPSITLFGSGESQQLNLVGRYSFAREERLGGFAQRRDQYAVGLHARLTHALHARTGYAIHTEGLSAPQAADNVFALSLTAEF